MDASEMQPVPVVVDGEWLSDRLSGRLGAPVIPVDVRPPQFYAQGHIPGAVNLPVFLLGRGGEDAEGREMLGRRLGALGIDPETHVVAYDDGGTDHASVMFRVLTGAGHRAVSVLDGGVTLWRHEGRDQEYTPVSLPGAQYEFRNSGEHIEIEADAVLGRLDDVETVILDVRSPAEYLGHMATAMRGGHIPGAVNVEWSNNLTQTPESITVLRPDDELRELYEQAGASQGKRAIVYCQSGHRASQTYMTLKKIGFKDVVVYLPGWQEWGNRQDLPVAE